MSRVLFVCLHNAGRSQMIEALFQRAAEGRHEARSAGTSPAARVHESVVTVMRDLDIDLSDRKPRMLTTELSQWADVVITMGCGDAVPSYPASATSTRTCRIQRTCPSSRCARFAMTYPPAKAS